jgi:D-alanyl-D-alanine carboxypeptidase/D-alanyl-D-alanine-endopeptidase (penicillin-binding protein 4)
MFKRWMGVARRGRGLPWAAVAPLAAGAAAALLAGPVRAAQSLPPEALLALQRGGVPAQALSVVIHDATSGRRVLQWQEQRSVNPASLTKLLTTMAALERLGPAYTWATPVWLTGPVKDGVLEGSLVIKGTGDPKLVLERVWLLLRRVQQLGVRRIHGDIVLDNAAFQAPEAEPGDFDGEPLRPYNVRASALLLNFRSAVYGFLPDEAAGVARVTMEPPLAGTAFDRTVPLAAGPCGDWRTALKAGFEAGRTRFAGSYATACGEQNWPVADPQPASFDARLIEALWREMGGQLQGTVREGPAPEGRPAFEVRSPALAEVIRDINKYSNNVMAQQLFYTLALQARRNNGAAGAAVEPVTADAARDTLLRWLVDRTGTLDGDTVIDNGSGLSRHTRITALRLARLLSQAFDSTVMSELMSSLPVSGLDGTLRRSRATPGRAHLKTGSLRDVAAVAGYVLSNSGRRFVLVAIINHPNANAARPALDALVQWTLRDTPAR